MNSCVIWVSKVIMDDGKIYVGLLDLVGKDF